MPWLGAQTGATEVVDGVHRFPRTGIKVVVVGGGVGGLFAALECWRKGCEVVVLERAEGLSSIGDCFTIAPSALVSLHHYPQMHAKYNEKIYDSPVSFWSRAGSMYFQEDPEWQVAPKHAASAHQKVVSFQKSRAEFAQMLLEQAKRLGIHIFWGCKVISYEEDTLSSEARVKTASGDVFAGDIVIAADGLHTKSHAVITGREVKAISSGYSISRVSFPRSAIPPDSKAYSILPGIKERPQFRIYPANDMHLMLMLNKDWCGFAFTHPDKSGNADESWSNFITKEDLISTLTGAGGDWDPAVVDFLARVPNTSKIVDWRLTMRDPQPQWTSSGGRIVQLGDSAHSFLPTAGTGAVQAMEDGLSLAECLRLGGRDGLPWSTKVHELLRFERVSTYQRAGFVNREKLHTSFERLEAAPDDVDAQQAVSTIHHAGPMLWDFDPQQYATDNYGPALEHLRGGTAFSNTNVPGGGKYVPWTLEEVLRNEQAALQAA